MATNAIYLFNNTDTKLAVKCYTHHDGSELHAARNLDKALNSSNKAGGLALQFIRAVPSAELVSILTPDVVDFIYTIEYSSLYNLSEVTVEEYTVNGTLNTKYTLPLSDFINNHYMF